MSIGSTVCFYSFNWVIVESNKLCGRCTFFLLPDGLIVQSGLSSDNYAKDFNFCSPCKLAYRKRVLFFPLASHFNFSIWPIWNAWNNHWMWLVFSLNSDIPPPPKTPTPTPKTTFFVLLFYCCSALSRIWLLLVIIQVASAYVVSSTLLILFSSLCALLVCLSSNFLFFIFPCACFF